MFEILGIFFFVYKFTKLLVVGIWIIYASEKCAEWKEKDITAQYCFNLQLKI